MDNNRRVGQLSFNPIKLAAMGHAGSPGARGETNDFLGAQFDALMDAREQIANCGIYCPDGDYNFLLWTLLPKTVEEQSYRCMPAEEGAGFEHVAPLRKDGGQYTWMGQVL